MTSESMMTVGVHNEGRTARDPRHADSFITHWVVSEVYYPEETATGHYMTMIAEGLARKVRVGVICGRPNYSRRGMPVANRETRNNVLIFRVWSSTLNKDVLLFRIINMATILVSMLPAVLLRIRRGDCVLVGTNPPLLPFLVAFSCWCRGARCVLRVEDIYPDNMVVAGLIRANGVVFRSLIWAHRLLYRRLHLICVLGRDMGRCIENRMAPVTRPIVCIPNWADFDEVRPLPREENALLKEYRLLDKFVVGYAGNVGPLQDIKHLYNCMLALHAEAHFHFLVVGSGKMHGWLQQAVHDTRLTNVSLIGPRPRSEQSVFLGACDIGIVSLLPGMRGLGVPSRAYNMMAAGKPILASMDVESEIALTVAEEKIGWVVPPGDVRGFVDAVQEAAANREQLSAMAERARKVASERFSSSTVIQQYCSVLQ